MARTPLAPIEARFRSILVEMGYASHDEVYYEKLASDISRRATGNVRSEELKAILTRGREIKSSELVTICQGLDIDAYEILYGEDGPPERKRRKPGKRLMDAIPKPL